MLEKWKRMELTLNLLAVDNEEISQRFPNNEDRKIINVCNSILKLIFVKKLYILITFYFFNRIQ
jgi:hypothetical protein